VAVVDNANQDHLVQAEQVAVEQRQTVEQAQLEQQTLVVVVAVARPAQLADQELSM
jgi:hypothetical protein